MRSIRVELRAKPEQRSRLVATLAAEAREVPVRFEGCERYAVFVHPEDDCRILLYEEWSDSEAFAAYRESDFFEQSGQVVFPMIDGAPDSAYYEKRPGRTVKEAVGVSVHDSTDLDDVVPFRIYQTQRLLRTHLMRFLGEHAEGLSPEQWFIVQRLAQRSPRRQAELSEPVLGDAPNITRLIDALVDRGLVARLPDPDDRRSWLVSLTQSGRQVVTRSRRPVVAARLDLFDGIGEAELAALLAMLDRIDAKRVPHPSRPDEALSSGHRDQEGSGTLRFVRHWPDRVRRALTGPRESERGADGSAVQPDLVLVMTDQQRFDQFGLTSDGLFETPHIDELAANGVTFDQAYSGGTNCVPARVSLLTGLQHHRVPKQPGSWTAMREGYWTIARELRRAGYATALVGKMHATPIRAQHGFDTLRLCEHLGYLAVSGGMDADEVDDYHDWLVGRGLADWRDETPAQWRSKVGRWFPYDADDHPTAWVEQEALSVLADRDPRRPLFLVVSFPHPHAPLNPPEPYVSKYNPSDMPLPTDDFAVNEHLPAPFLEAMNATRKGRTPQRVGSTRENLAGTLTRTRALIAQIDDSVGRILDQIDLTRTLVVFTSDHGDYAGHRGLLQKNPSIPFDDLARVPMIVAGLDTMPGRRVPALVQSFDFVPTCLDYAAIDMSPDLLDSRSLRPLLRGGTGAADAERTVMCATLGWPMLRRGPYKYILHRASGTAALFDLERDPGETTNLAARNEFAAISAELRGSLDENLTRGLADLETVP